MVAAATITGVPAVRQGADYSLNMAMADGQKHQVGTLTFDGGDYAAGGIEWTPKGIPNLAFISLTNGDGYMIQYDYTNKKIQVYEAGVDGEPLDEFAASAISLVIRFRAVGY